MTQGSFYQNLSSPPFFQRFLFGGQKYIVLKIMCTVSVLLSLTVFKCSVCGVYDECRFQRLYLCEHHILECVELLNDSLWIYIGIISLFKCEVLQTANLWYPLQTQ